MRTRSLPGTALTTFAAGLLSTAYLAACGPERARVTDEHVEDLVRRSYQDIAMYNVNNKFAQKQGGWNTIEADTQLKDHTLREIARPNNDTLYLPALLDLRHDPVILEMPAFDSKYVSLMVTAYDHFVNVPMATRLGDFARPEKVLFYSERTEGYDGEPVEGVDRIFETTGDFVSAVLRIMPHASDPDRFRRITDQMESVRLLTLAEYEGGGAKPIDDIDLPEVGQTDVDVFGTNFFPVMQFVFNHTTFDREHAEDRALLAAFGALGIEPGGSYEPVTESPVEGERLRETADRVRREWLGALADQEKFRGLQPRIFQPKNQTDLEAVLTVSIRVLPAERVEEVQRG